MNILSPVLSLRFWTLSSKTSLAFFISISNSLLRVLS
nr:MAG TPA: hypothetical protein [Caudoviricetes sp.]